MNGAPMQLQMFAECLRTMALVSDGDRVARHLLRLDMHELYEFAWKHPEKLTVRAL